ncbi:hypothetical protein ABAC402_00325 [Asticcacaulis sp. AC402]|nr:hypothetical protein ABAC402_00325 [Asticcacaulis sp. AC402]
MLYLISELRWWLLLALVLGVAVEYAARRYGK